jgi:hypothetical protein
MAHGVTHVAMESTGVYWKPVFYVLEDGLTCVLVNAAHVMFSLLCSEEILPTCSGDSGTSHVIYLA